MSVKSVAKMIDNRLCLSTSAMCDVLDVHRNTLAQWVKLGMPKCANGWYPLKECLAWVQDYKGASSNQVPEREEKMTLAQQKLYYEAKLKEQQTEAATLKNAIAKGEYIKRDDVVAELQRFFTTLKRSMSGFSRRIAMEVAPFVEPEQVRIIEQNIADTTNAVLLQLSVRGVYDAREK